MVEREEIIRRVEGEAASILLGSQAVHDWDHTCRVRKNALSIARAEGADIFIVEVAAMLHDVGRPVELADFGKTDHASLGAEMVPDILHRLGLKDEIVIAHIASCIRTHRFRRRDIANKPASIEAKCVYDADKLDSMGAIGIGRSFHFAGHTGARVHNTADEALNSASYSRDDTAYREYLVKLRYLKENMLTRSGFAMAQQRHDFMVHFFEELNQETQ